MIAINNKLLGYVILANSILIGFIIFLFKDAIAKIAENSCVHVYPALCTMLLTFKKK
jgi:hypothetical protein